ncbi:MAG: DUF1015 domain-containing protein [Candidatus Dormiibacterota bacterium]
MAQVSGFRGIRYDPAMVQLESVLAPPYDVISPKLQQDLYGRAMQNVVRLELGRDFESDVAGERDRYTRARDYLGVWLAEGILIQDDQPSVYIYRQSFRPPGGGGPRERLGCFVGIQPVPYDRREILRHELTLTAPRADRLRLIQTTRAQTSPVFLLYENSAEVTTELLRLSSVAPPAAEAVTEGEYGSERHQLWRVSDPNSVAGITSALSQTRLFIADGHHRYETALQLGLPQVLALVSPMDSEANVIFPTHRVVPDAARGLDDLSQALTPKGWQIQRTAGLEEALLSISSLRDTDHAFVVASTSGRVVAHRARRQNDAPSPRLRLDVAVLETEILEPLLGITPEDAAAGRLLYSRDAEEAVELAISKRGLAFLVNPPSVEEMAAVALADEAMPQKSTYFFPKVPAGLVIMSTE